MSVLLPQTRVYEGPDTTYIVHPTENVRILAVCTDGRHPGLLNYKIALERLGYRYTILGVGQKWGGWIWRTKQYLEELEKMSDDQLIVLSDATDVLFIEPPALLVKKFLEMKSCIVIGAERGLTTGKYKYDLSARRLMRESYKLREPDRSYRFPNGGLIMGYRIPLIRLLYANRESEDDQAGLVELYNEDQSWFTLDTNCKLFGNLVQRAPFFDEDLEVAEASWWSIVWDVTNINTSTTNNTTNKKLRLVNIETGGNPSVLHFAGGNWTWYNKLGPLIIGPIHQAIYPSGTEAVKQVVKQPWTSSLVWIISGPVQYKKS